MTYEIKATLSDLRDAAATIDEQAAIIKGEVNSLNSLMGQLRQSFLGERASTFFTQFDNGYSEMETWFDIVRSFSEELRTAADSLQRADQGG